MTEAAAGLEALAGWQGRTQTLHQRLDPRSVVSMAATLGSEGVTGGPGTPLPPGWHWMMFTTFLPVDEIGPDGLPKGGGFLPPVPQMGRMWAGGRLTWQRPLLVGRDFSRTSTIASVQAKEGRSGPLIFVTVRHEIADAGGICVSEEQDTVFRAPPKPGSPAGAPPAAPAEAVWRRSVTADPIMLFRFSALTFNAHRIHYDQPYATQVEHYPGLLVTGPLIAMLLLDLVRRHAPSRDLAGFTFRAVSPLYDIAPFTVNGAPTAEGCRVWAANDRGQLAMDATGRFA